MTRVFLAGDIMLGDSAGTVGFGINTRLQALGIDALLGRIRSAWAEADHVLANLECVLATEGVGASRHQRDQMRAQPSTARALREVGFTALSVANNHAMQHGRDGFCSTVSALEDAGIAVVGVRGKAPWSSRPAIVPGIGGQRLGLLGYCCRPRQYFSQDPPYAEGEVAAICDDVARLSRAVDEVIVSLHWGEEFVPLPSHSEVESAQRIVDAGARVVFGHHPHVARPVHRYADGVIAYSLGNLVSDMVWYEPLARGMLLSVDFSRGDISAEYATTVTHDDYSAAMVGPWHAVRPDPVHRLGEGEYAEAIAVSILAQRRAQYAYTLRNLHRLPVPVMLSLAGTTIRNKIAGVLRLQ